MMFSQHPAADAISNYMKDSRTPKAAPAKPVLDGCDDKDTVYDAAGDYAANDIALKAVASLQQWAETSPDDLDDGEGLADRLFAMMVGIADANFDGDLSEDEQEILAMAGEAAWDYLSSKGVSDEDCSALLEDWDNDVAANVQEMLSSALPDGDAAMDEMDSFVFGDGSDEATMDAVYKKTFAIRKGKKMRINKRVSGKVRLSAKQKLSIRKAGMKSHRAGAQMKRAKSMKLRRNMGM